MIKTGLTASAIFIAIASGIALWASFQLPETGRIPIHWNIKGEVDGWTSPQRARWILWAIPALMTFMAGLLAMIVKIEPRQANIRTSARAFLTVWISAMALLTGAGAIVALSMTAGTEVSFTTEQAPRFILAGISLLFVTMGNVLPKTRSNFSIGIRTPWTLSSAEAWEKTHRYGGRLFMLMGLAGLAGALTLPIAVLIAVFVGGTVACVLSMVVYSYFAWRNASDRELPPEEIV